MPSVPLARPTAIASAAAPFVWQHGRRWLLLDVAAHGWTVAELRFEAERCRYVEVRRATYRWPREAAGALLARLVVLGEAPLDQAAQALSGWLAGVRAATPPADDHPAV